MGLRDIEHPDERGSESVLGKRPERSQIISAIGSRNDDAFLVRRHQFGIHHYARNPSVAIGERMHLTNEDHHIDSALEWVVQCLEKFEAALQRAFDQIGRDEHRITGTIDPVLECTGRFVASRLHHRRVTPAQQVPKACEV